VFKRAVDIAVSAVLLVAALPLLLVAALIIRLTSPGPVLFRQIRMGRGFQTFEILKLRTMAHAEAGLAFTLGPDPRITPVGKWLRRTKFDEPGRSAPGVAGVDMGIQEFLYDSPQRQTGADGPCFIEVQPGGSASCPSR